ncbi:EAL domain-containing protein [Aliivibrio fischeri]|uniref:EAL domain-containing protein n=1 Tax=Aliivibrio fischeri TaxID=668 RepID=UPI0012D98391|nr:EAL domain-containing protein [Aliivibrio fischeri]MUK39192.1 EAL domain-containing protein [Aliivibrio fischeri]MUL04108.1 EAL domain-containing protein [Aliivibrio fischeri]MUL06666.1 EAL domain-containing protein [Aliivibrio fischeri]
MSKYTYKVNKIYSSSGKVLAYDLLVILNNLEVVDFSYLSDMEFKTILIEQIEYLSTFRECLISININLMLLKLDWFNSEYLPILEALKTENDLMVSLKFIGEDTLFVARYDFEILNLKTKGFQIWMGDFGHKETNLGFIKKVKTFDVIKLSQTFVEEMFQFNQSLLSDVIKALRAQNITLIVSGINNELMLDFVSKHYCFGIGNYYS